MTAARPEPVGAASVWSARFTTWLAAATVSAVGDGVLYFAIGWTAAGLGGQTAGLMLSLVVLPRTLLMLVGGAVGDRVGLRKAVIGCDVVMCLALLAYLVLEQTSLPAEFLLASLALAIGTVSAFRLPAAGALPRLFVEGDAIPRALAMTGSLLSTARLVGPPLGGVVVAALAMTGAVAANLISFVVILVVLVAVRPPYDRPPAQAGGSAARQIGQALVAARQTPGIAPLLGAVALVAASLLPMLSLGIPLVARDRGWSAGATGLIETAWITGTLAVSLLVARKGTRRRPLAPLVAGPLVASLGVLVIAASPTPAPALVGAAVMGIGTAAFTSHVLPLYLLRTPEDMLARFQALLGVVQAAPILIAHNALGAIASYGSPTLTMVVAAGISLLAALVPLTSRTVRTADATEPRETPEAPKSVPSEAEAQPASAAR